MTADQILLALLQRFSKAPGCGCVISGAPASGKTGLLANLRRLLKTRDLMHVEPRLRGPLAAMGEHRPAACLVSLGNWTETRLQAVFSLEIARQLPPHGVPLSGSLLGREAAELLAVRGYSGLVILADDLDRFLDSRADPTPDQRFLDDLAGSIEVYLLPLWVIFTQSGSPDRPWLRRYESQQLG